MAGPTASGKSALALRLAQEIGGTVINADAMQVYRDLAILTARPTAADTAAVPHLLFGFVPAEEAYSAGRFAADAARAIEEARQAGRVPIIVGGTGLYFQALTDGLSPIPAIAEEVRRHWREEARRLGGAGLHALLDARDPEMAARLSPTDPQRLTRALEVLDATGRSLSYWQRKPRQPVLGPADATRLVLVPGRDWLIARCDARFDAMLRNGALEEAGRLRALGLDPALPIMRALGVRPLMACQEGRLSLAGAAEQAKAETRQFARRQMTWQRGHMLAWRSLTTQELESFRL